MQLEDEKEYTNKTWKEEGTLEKTCATCFYDKGKCEILKEKIDNNCYAWADEREAKKRETAIKKYSGGNLNGNVPAAKSLPKEEIERRTITRLENVKKRNGKSVKEVLDEHFNWYYMQGLTDEEIGLKLYIDRRHVAGYRHDKKLPPWKEKNRPAETETAM